ncbi:MAG: ATP-dependent zinc metalloprotease FtsH [Alphaproteobacteria bacterium]|nr:ATP-dependent zinc metalloprotease FtsH [Alphaproteobacteria bacterium]MCW5740470.1 ATP-dependent zinc metalloprotease FtsH [Alphaproteobacteria bacterium]
MRKDQHLGFWLAVAMVLAMLFVRDYWQRQLRVDHIAFSEFLTLLEAGRVAEVVVGDTSVRGTIANPAPNEKPEFVAERLPIDVAAFLDRYKVRYRAEPDSGWLRSILSWVLPTALFAFIWIMVMRRMQGSGGLLAIGKSKARVYIEKSTGVDFSDVAGVDEAKDELKEIVDFLKDPKRNSRLGARLPRGILLVGPPGTGKTLLARALAGEAGVPFFSISGAEFVEMFVGVGAARVRDLFEQARAHAPCIIFIDELDALGRARGSFALGGHDEKEQTLNQLLSELDGFDSRSGIVLLAATNRPEILDPALLRAGRFDRQVLVDRPDKKGRIEVLKVHVRKIRLAADLDLAQIAALTPGFTGADLANLVNEAALLATRRDATDVTLDDFTRAIERIVAGLEKRNRILNPQERRTIAVHEVGHALVAMTLPGTDAVQKISIIPRGIGALGYTIQRPTEDRFLMDQSELETKLAVLLGGRAAEMLRFASVSTGAADDLRKATDIARSMVARFGMVPELGVVAYDIEAAPLLSPLQTMPVPRWYSEATAARIDAAVQRIIGNALDRARTVLAAHAALLDSTVETLLERETMGPAELEPLARLVARPKAAA